MFKPSDRVRAKHICQHRSKDVSDVLCHECSINTSDSESKPPSALKSNPPSNTQSTSSESSTSKLPNDEVKQLSSENKQELSSQQGTRNDAQQSQSSTALVQVISKDAKHINNVLEEENESIANLKSIKRFVRSKDQTSIDNIVLPNQPVVPEVCKNSVIDTIVNRLDFENGDGNIQSKFESLSDAEAHFLQKFGYIQDNETDIMDFKFPAVVKQNTKSKDTDYANATDFHLKWKSIKYLFENKYVDDLAVNFILKCYNMALGNNIPEGSIPDIVFGDTYDVKMVVPDDHGPDSILSKGIDLTLVDRPDDFDENFCTI